MLKKSFALFICTVFSSINLTADPHPLSYHNHTDKHVDITVKIVANDTILSENEVRIPAKTCVRTLRRRDELAANYYSILGTPYSFTRILTFNSDGIITTHQHTLAPENTGDMKTIHISYLSKGEQIGCKVTLE